MIVNALIVVLSVALWPMEILKKMVDLICDDYAGLSDGPWQPSDGGLSNGMVIKLERIDGIPPQWRPG